MNFIQQKTSNYAKNPIKRFARNVPAGSDPDAGSSGGMLEMFFSNTGTGFPRMPPGANKPAEKGSRHPTSGHTSGHNASHEPHVVLVITEGRNNARGEVGIAALNINSPTLILSQFSDDLWYTGTIIKIQMLDPAEIIVPNTVFTEDRLIKDSKLMKIIFKAFPNVRIKPAMRKFFNDVEAMGIINDLCSSHCQSVKLALEGKYYALAAAGGLFRYLKTILCVVFAPDSLQIVYEAKYASMMIDVETSKRLELVASLMPKKNKNSCLYQLLDKCMTSVGKRSLRARILAPLCDVKQIREFQEAVQELIDNQPLLDTLRQVLKKFRSVDRMQKLCVVVPQTDVIRAAELMISHVITFKSSLEAIPQLFDILSTLTHKSFENMRQGLEDPRYGSMLEQIDQHIVKEIQYERGQKLFLQRIHAVKEKSNVFLDISRKLYYCLLDNLKNYVKSISQKYEISLELSHNCLKGYHVVLSFDPKKPLPQIPDEFEVLARRGSKILMRTEEIAKLDRRIRDVVNEIVIISNQVIDKILINIRKDIECVYMLTGVIVEIDLLQNFATLGSIDGFVCPSFGPNLTVTDGIHPFLEFGYNHVEPVPNNVIATSDYNFFLITGPNMGGKTVYIKMVALLQIMAQIGAFVPATDATFRICDKLFSRMGFEDTVQRGVSNFDHEMRQTEYILKTISPNSLVIIDELGRSTNPHEGKIWAWGMCEELANLKGYSNDGRYFDMETESDTNPEQVAKDLTKLMNITSPFIFLTTHFKELTKLADYHFNMVNLYLHAEETVDENGQTILKYIHKVKCGVTPLKAYGLSLARQVKFPKNIIPRAEEIYKKLETVSEKAEIQPPNNLAQLSERWKMPHPKESLQNERKLYDLYANLATILRETPEKVSEDFMKKEVAKILKNFVDSADPQFLLDLKTKPASRVLDASFTNSDKTLPPNTSLNLESIRQDLSSERTLSNVASEFRAILNTPIERLAQTNTKTPVTLLSPPKRSIPEKIVKPDQRKQSPVINFNLRTPFQPKSRDSFWENLPSHQVEKRLSVSSTSRNQETFWQNRSLNLPEKVSPKNDENFWETLPSNQRALLPVNIKSSVPSTSQNIRTFWKTPPSNQASQSRGGNMIPVASTSKNVESWKTRSLDQTSQSLGRKLVPVASTSKNDESFWEILPSSQASLFSAKVVPAATVNVEFDLFDHQDEKPTDDFFFPTPGPSQERLTSIVNLISEDEEEIQSEYEMVVSSHVASTQENAFNMEISYEFDNIDSESCKGKSSDTKGPTKEFSSEGDFFKKPIERATSNSWDNLFDQRKNESAKRIKEESGKSSSEEGLSEISSITKKTPLNFMERYREKVISRMGQPRPLKPLQSKILKSQKPSITHIPRQSIGQMMVRQQIAAEVSRSSRQNEESSEKSSDAPTESQMSASSGKIPWFPDIGTLQETQAPTQIEETSPSQKPPQKERLVLNLAKLHEFEKKNK